MKYRNLSEILKKTVRENLVVSVTMLFMILASIILALIPPLVLEKIVNFMADGSGILLTMAFLYFGMLVLSGLTDALKEVMITVFGQKVTHGIRSRMSDKIAVLPAEYFVKNESGKVTSRFVNDVDTVESLFTNGVISMFTDACKVISVVIVIWIKSKGLGIMMLVVTPLLFFMTRIFQKKMLCAQLENRKAIGKVNNHVPETIKNIRMIRSFSKQKYMEQRYEDYIEESYGAMEASNFYDSIYSPIVIMTSSVMIAVLMIFSASNGTIRSFFGMSVGTAVAVIAYVGKVFDPIESLGMEIQNIQSAVAGMKRVEEYLEEKERIVPQKETNSKEEIAIDFSDVSFGYNKDTLILKDLSFQIKRGENVTLAGRTGAGKSTIFKLLLGLYSPEQGSILINGTKAEDIADKEKRKLFGYVEQNLHPILGSVRDQITLGDCNFSQQEVEAATRLAGIHETILGLEQGYDTMWKENLFSQGQLQLLSIARAVIADPKIMLLDEITANLDTMTEEKVMNAIQKASESRTVISISHRLYEQSKSRLITI